MTQSNQITTLHKGNEQGIDQQNLNRNRFHVTLRILILQQINLAGNRFNLFLRNLECGYVQVRIIRKP